MLACPYHTLSSLSSSPSLVPPLLLSSSPPLPLSSLLSSSPSPSLFPPLLHASSSVSSLLFPFLFHVCVFCCLLFMGLRSQRRHCAARRRVPVALRVCRVQARLYALPQEVREPYAFTCHVDVMRSVFVCVCVCVCVCYRCSLLLSLSFSFAPPCGVRPSFIRWRLALLPSDCVSTLYLPSQPSLSLSLSLSLFLFLFLFLFIFSIGRCSEGSTATGTRDPFAVLRRSCSSLSCCAQVSLLAVSLLFFVSRSCLSAPVAPSSFLAFPLFLHW